MCVLMSLCALCALCVCAQSWVRARAFVWIAGGGGGGLWRERKAPGI